MKNIYPTPMTNLLNIYEKNVNHKPLFSETITVDYYDGATEAICKASELDTWFIASAIYMDLYGLEGTRIFFILPLTAEWIKTYEKEIAELREQQYFSFRKIKRGIKKYYESYEGKGHLYKGAGFWLTSYELLEVDSRSIKYFSTVYKVVTQSKLSNEKWLKYFQK
jgi:hypothetical protein